jgi:hypothetical protein
MARLLRASLVAIVAFLGGCVFAENFRCKSDVDCTRGGEAGTCVLGSCLFPDATCPRGKRWDATAQAWAGQCLCSDDFSSDPANCGGCGSSCPPPDNASSTACVAGACAIATCSLGFRDCDGKYDNGCEANVFTSDVQLSSAIDHCGACGNRCPLSPNAAITGCQLGACQVRMCAEGFLDCDTRYDNGCECSTGVCASGSCASPTCTDGVKNGNETDVDCGGGSCLGCYLNKRCNLDSDCGSNYCSSGKCTPFCDKCQFTACCGTFCAGYRSVGSYCFSNSSCASCYCDQSNPMNPYCR